MPISERENELIFRYLDKGLDSSERAEFDALCEGSADFREEVEVQQVMMASIKAQGKAALKNELKAALNQEQHENQFQPDVQKESKKAVWLMVGGIAAGVALLVVLLFGPHGAADTESIYLSHYQVLKADNEFRNESGNLPLGIDLYQKRAYKQAIPELKVLLEQDEQGMAGIYLGLAYWEEAQEKEAARIFEHVINNSTDDFIRQYAEWYLALIWLKSGEQEKAEAAFVDIVAQEGVYTEQAQSILEELK